MYIIYGLLIIVIGTLIVIKSEWLLDNFGRIAFFESHLGSEGGSRLGYKLIGIAIIFIGMMVMTNMIGDFLNWIFSPLLRFSKPQA